MASRWDSNKNADFHGSDRLESTIEQVKERNKRLLDETFKLRALLNTVCDGLMQQEISIDTILRAETSQQRLREKTTESFDVLHGNGTVKQQRPSSRTTPAENRDFSDSGLLAGDDECYTPVQAGTTASGNHALAQATHEGDGDTMMVDSDWLLTRRSEKSAVTSEDMLSPSPQTRRTSVSVPRVGTAAKPTKAPVASETEKMPATENEFGPLDAQPSPPPQNMPEHVSEDVVVRQPESTPSAPLESPATVKEVIPRNDVGSTSNDTSTSAADPKALLAFIDTVKKAVAELPVLPKQDLPDKPVCFQLDFLSRALGCAPKLNFTKVCEDMFDDQAFPCTEVVKIDPSHQLVAAVRGRHGTLMSVLGQEGQGEFGKMCPLFWKNKKGWEYGGEYMAYRRMTVPPEAWEGCSEDEKRSFARKVAEATWGHRLLMERGLVKSEDEVPGLSLEQIMGFFRRVM